MMAPTTPVINMSKAEEPPKGKRLAMREDNMLSFCVSIIKASKPQKIKMLTKPVSQAMPGFWYIKAATPNDTSPTLQNGKYNPAAKLTTIVSNTETPNFIM